MKRILQKISLFILISIAASAGLFSYFLINKSDQPILSVLSEKRITSNTQHETANLFDLLTEKDSSVLGTTAVNIRVGGWIPNSDFAAGLDSIKTYTPELFQVQYAGAAVVESGEVGFGTNFEANMSALNALGIPFGLNLISTRFGGSENFLKQEAQQRAFFEKVIWCKSNYANFTTININFENMHLNQKQHFYDFLNQVRAVTTTHNIEMNVTVFARFEADKNVFETKEIHDYSLIGSIADKVIIMGYDYPMVQGGSGPFAPNSPNTWLEQILDYATKRIPKEKIIMALPLYGYSFNNNSARPSPKSVNTFPSIQNIITKEGLTPKYDEDFNEMYLERATERLYYQDKNTLNKKKELVAKYGVDKVFYWRIGRDGGIGF